jgi:hypothetical protein
MTLILNENDSLTKILLCAIQLSSKYDSWKNNENITHIIDINNNLMCKQLKKDKPHLDDITIQSISLAYYMCMSIDIMNNNII